MTVYTQNVILSQLVIPHVELSNPSFNCLAKLEAPNLKKIIKYCVGKSMLLNISQNKIMLRTLTKGCLLEYLQKRHLHMKIKHLAAVGPIHLWHRYRYYRQVNINQSKNAGEQLVKTVCVSFLIFLAPSNHLQAESVWGMRSGKMIMTL